MANSEEFAPRFWFEVLFGFKESKEEVYKNFDVIEHEDHVDLKSKCNDRIFNAGDFQIRTSDANNEQFSNAPNGGKLHIIRGHGKNSKHYELIDVLSMQSISEWDGATYLAASNFNCLEFVNSNQTAKAGVTGYYADRTQGPYAALACGPAIVYRNYFLKHGDKIGQLTTEINLLDETGITVEHGYAKIPDDKVLKIDIESQSEKKKGFSAFFSNLFSSKKSNENKPKLSTWYQNPKIWKVGVHRNCEVVMTQSNNGSFCKAPENRIAHHVYAAAFNFTFDVVRTDLTYQLAKELLTAEYRATILAAWENSLLLPIRRGSKKLSLTLLGGGVFRNPYEIICESIIANLELIKQSGLDVYITCYDDTAYNNIIKHIQSAVEETKGKIYDTDDDQICRELIEPVDS